MDERTSWPAACPACGDVCEQHPVFDGRVLCRTCRHTWGSQTLAVAASNRARRDMANMSQRPGCGDKPPIPGSRQ